MFRFLVGTAGGVVGVVAWLLSEPENGAPAASGPLAIAEQRLHVLQTRFKAALADGQAARVETETRMQRRLDEARIPAGRPRGLTGQ